MLSPYDAITARKEKLNYREFLLSIIVKADANIKPKRHKVNVFFSSPSRETASME
jgi:hypothetical protein